MIPVVPYSALGVSRVQSSQVFQYIIYCELQQCPLQYLGSHIFSLIAIFRFSIWLFAHSFQAKKKLYVQLLFFSQILFIKEFFCSIFNYFLRFSNLAAITRIRLVYSILPDQPLSCSFYLYLNVQGCLPW